MSKSTLCLSIDVHFASFCVSNIKKLQKLYQNTHYQHPLHAYKVGNGLQSITCWFKVGLRGSPYFSATSVCKTPPAGSVHAWAARSCPPSPDPPYMPDLAFLPNLSFLPDPAFCPSIRHIRPQNPPTPNPSSVILPCSRHWTTPERVSKLGRGCCIASLGFGRAVTLIDVVLVARHGGGHCGSRSEICLFWRMVWFCNKEVTEDLWDEEALVSNLEIHAGTIAHKDTNTCLKVGAQ